MRGCIAFYIREKPSSNENKVIADSKLTKADTYLLASGTERRFVRHLVCSWVLFVLSEFLDVTISARAPLRLLRVTELTSVKAADWLSAVSGGAAVQGSGKKSKPAEIW